MARGMRAPTPTGEMARGSRSKQARRQARDGFGRFARRVVRCGGRTASPGSKNHDASGEVSRPRPRSESGNGMVAPVLPPSESGDGGYIDVDASDEERPSSAQGPSRDEGDARLRRPLEASGSKPRRASLPQMKKGAFHEDHNTVTATGGKRRSISNNYDWTEFYGMYLEAVNDKKVVQEQLAEAKEMNNELTSALAEAKKKNHTEACTCSCS
ncbi:hypothetical protein ACP70R_043224 [Stipagrostis hirtigluma subsp. patula]